jgi:ribosomal protein S18 acetylase RimI-like enzyme
LRLIPLSSDLDAGRDFLNKRCLQIGHVLPLNDKLFNQYFPLEQSFLLYHGKKVAALFSYSSGSHKGAPNARFRVVSDSRLGLREAVGKVEETALAQEKLIVRTTVFGYDSKKLAALKSAGYGIGASLPQTVSLNGRKYDWHLLYRSLTGRYSFNVKRPYAKPGLYPKVEVKKAEKSKLKVRGYRPEDRVGLDRFASHPMVIRGIASGVFEGLCPWPSGGYQQMVDSGVLYPIVCEDETTGQPVGLLDLSKQTQDVMQHTMMLGIYVKPEYQGVGVGTMLVQAMKTVAMRLHLTRVWLSVFEGNESAERLYRKAGFVECGKVPEWLQEGYVNETYMTLKLD